MSADILGELRLKKPFLESRGRLLSSLRGFFATHDYLEVDTSVMVDAPAPEAYIEAPSVTGGGFLRTSPELQMKIMLSAGYERIYQIGSCFREGEYGKNHNPEFTMLEWYEAGGTYEGILEFTAAMLRHLADDLPPVRKDFDFSRHEILTVQEAFKRYADADAAALLHSGEFEEVLVEKVEPHLGKGCPLFLIDYPAEASAFARLNPDDPTVSERFELYINGIEIANAYGELTDPEIQIARFKAYDAIRRANGGKPYPEPTAFLAAIRAGLPASAGCALGIDRLAAFFSGAPTIHHVRF